MKVCKKPCKDCPWRKTSPKGWLGGQDPEVFTHTLQMGKTLPCHKTQDRDLTFDEIEKNDKVHHCRGALITMKNSCMLSRNEKIAELQKNINTDNNFFRTLNDFQEHHNSIGAYTLEEFLESEEWENFVTDEGDDNIARELYKKVVDKAKCKGCGSICEDIDQYYETYHGGMMSGNGFCIYCAGEN